MSEREWLFAIFMLGVLIANILVLVTCLKLYTEMFKEIASQRRPKL